MSETFADFASTLSDDERATLLGSIPRLIVLIAAADDAMDQREAEVGIDALIAAVEELGDEFRHSPEAQDSFDKMARRIIDGDEDGLPFLSRLRDVVRAMPEPLAKRYRDFVAAMCVSIAKASGGFLFWGEKINDAEAAMLRRIVIALDLEITDEDVRKRLELRVFSV